jgi:nitrate reductase NapAB chaperone NapD
LTQVAYINETETIWKGKEVVLLEKTLADNSLSSAESVEELKSMINVHIFFADEERKERVDLIHPQLQFAS